MTRRPWTPEDRAEVRRRYPHERTADIARDLNRSHGAVFGEASSMGLLAIAREILNNPDSCSAYLHNMAVHAVGKATT